MKLSPPTSAAWWIAFVLVVLAVLLNQGILSIAGLGAYAFWMVVLAALLLLLATRLHNL